MVDPPRLLFTVVILATLLVPGFGRAQSDAPVAHRRVAIVVGVGDYGGRGDLPNPPHDAAQMTQTLSRLGYDVRTLLNPKRSAVRQAVAAVAAEPGPIDQLVFFFSGHGGSIGGRSMLALNDGDARRPDLVELPLATLIGDIAGLHADSTLFVLDACRSNEGLGLFAGRSGLSQPPKTLGAFFAYAAAPGDVAYDSGTADPDLSPFTFAFADELLVPNQDIGVVMRHVRARVAATTGGRQLPWSEDALTTALLLNEAPAAPELFALYGRSLRGDAGASRQLGMAYVDGHGVAKDLERGTALLRAAAAAHDAGAMLALGDIEAGRDANALAPGSKSAAWYRQAADAGSADGSYRLAEMGRKQIGPDQKPPDAVMRLYNEAAQRGQADARARYLAYNLRHAFDPAMDRPATLAALRANAASGNKLSAVELGRVYGTPGSPELDYREADFWLEKAVRDGSTAALLEQAKLFGTGRGRPKDAVRAYDLTAQAAARGDADAMLFLGRMLIHGDGIGADPAAGATWFRRAMEAGQREGFADLGVCYEQGIGVDRNTAEAVALYRRGAALKDPVSTRSLAIAYEMGVGVRRNMDRALQLYRAAEALGDARAKASLGILAGQGMLTSVPDPRLGYELLKAALQHAEDGPYTLKLAEMTEAGVAGPPDLAEAARLYQRALNQGSAEAANELGALFYSGKGVPRDTERAAALWRQAAAAGDPAAYGNMAHYYQERGLSPDDAVEAGRWLRRGAEAGESEVMVSYARALFLGTDGVVVDRVAALDWLDRALGRQNGWAAGTLKAIVADPVMRAAPADRDGATLVLTRAAQMRGNALAVETLAQIDAVQAGVDLRRAAQADLQARLAGPQRGTAALLLGLGEQAGRYGAPADPGAAERLYRIAADAGEPQAWRRLGDLHRHRLIPQASDAAALADYTTGAQAGDAAAMMELGVMHWDGVGTRRDLARGIDDFRQAAAKGNALAMFNLGVAYQEGEGVPASPEQAEDWFEKGSATGNTEADVGLAGVLLNRPEGDRDYTRAFYHLYRAAAAGREEAFGLLDEMCRSGELPGYVRAHALALLVALPAKGPAGGLLTALVRNGVARQDAAGFSVAP